MASPSNPGRFRGRLRTDAAKPMRVRDNVLYLVFKLAVRLSTNWARSTPPTS
ncbi:MAG TPA: hypothetical protein VMW47_00835 [Verrucomicrobiae bacterium]|nr:hypothetical protein [Verrucomicrobiae bacterium]